MEITAIWERSNGISVFALDNNSGRLLCITPQTELSHYDKDMQPVYQNTGFPEISDAFRDTDTFDLNRADFFIKHFGGQLVWTE
jgi:hypothetical protein